MKRESFSHYANGPRLLADIGGASASFGLETAPGQIEAVWVAECAAYPTLGAAIVHYLSQPASVAAGGYQARYARLFAPGLHVLSYNEIPENREVSIIGTVG